MRLDLFVVISAFASWSCCAFTYANKSYILNLRDNVAVSDGNYLLSCAETDAFQGKYLSHGANPTSLLWSASKNAGMILPTAFVGMKLGGVLAAQAFPIAVVLALIGASVSTTYNLLFGSTMADKISAVQPTTWRVSQTPSHKDQLGFQLEFVEEIEGSLKRVKVVSMNRFFNTQRPRFSSEEETSTYMIAKSADKNDPNVVYLQVVSDNGKRRKWLRVDNKQLKLHPIKMSAIRLHLIK